MAIITRTAAIYRRYIARSVSPPLSSHISNRFLSHRSVPNNPIYEPFQFNCSSSFSSSPDYPSGDLNSIPHTGLPHTGLNKLFAKFKTTSSELLPSSRTILLIILEGHISEKNLTHDAHKEVVFLPDICENLLKASHDDSISMVYIIVKRLRKSWGWAKLEEVRRSLLNFKKQSNKMLVGYIRENLDIKEFYLASVFDEIFVHPDVHVFACAVIPQIPEKKEKGKSLLESFLEAMPEPRVFSLSLGKYKRPELGSSLDKEVKNMISSLQRSNWISKVSFSRGKTSDETALLYDRLVGNLIDLKVRGFITAICPEKDLVIYMSNRFGVKSAAGVMHRADFCLSAFYSKVSRSSVGISGGFDKIGIIRVSGSIMKGIEVFGRKKGIYTNEFIKLVRSAANSTEIRAVVVRIDCPGGDSLASDLMRREVKVLASLKPVVISMSDCAASGAYVLSLGATAIVAESQTITGSIGVVTSRTDIEAVYRYLKIKNLIFSIGKYAQMYKGNHRDLMPHEKKQFVKHTNQMYVRFRNQVALSRQLSDVKAEQVSQGRAWTGELALRNGLIDEIGGIDRAVAIAKVHANIPSHVLITLVEITDDSTDFERWSALGKKDGSANSGSIATTVTAIEKVGNSSLLE